MARHCAAHPWRALLLWVVGAATAFALAAAVGAPAQEDWDAPGTPSQRGVDLLRAHLPEAGNASAQVVVHDRRRRARARRRAGRARQPAGRPAPRAGCRPAAGLGRRGHRPAHREVRRPRHPPRPDGSRRAAGGGRRADPGVRSPGGARRRAARHGPGAGEGHRRADRHRRRPGHPAADVRLGRRRRPPGAGRGGRARRGHAPASPCCAASCR